MINFAFFAVLFFVLKPTPGLIFEFFAIHKNFLDLKLTKKFEEWVHWHKIWETSGGQRFNSLPLKKPSLLLNGSDAFLLA